MKYNIKVTKIPQSRLEQTDLNNVPFGTTFSDHMFMADYIDGEWTNCEILPYGNLTLSPANLAIHYGQSLFEGMKATKGNDGKPYLFRPEEHVLRINASAERMCMPAIPGELFLEALHYPLLVESSRCPDRLRCAR
ncbi:MAG: branched chain amino acid aminotransferase, partial [Bacteroidota bacterium]